MPSTSPLKILIDTRLATFQSIKVQPGQRFQLLIDGVTWTGQSQINDKAVPTSRPRGYGEPWLVDSRFRGNDALLSFFSLQRWNSIGQDYQMQTIDQSLNSEMDLEQSKLQSLARRR